MSRFFNSHNCDFHSQFTYFHVCCRGKLENIADPIWRKIPDLQEFGGVAPNEVLQFSPFELFCNFLRFASAKTLLLYFAGNFFVNTIICSYEIIGEMPEYDYRGVKTLIITKNGIFERCHSYNKKILSISPYKNRSI